MVGDEMGNGKWWGAVREGWGGGVVSVGALPAGAKFLDGNFGGKVGSCRKRKVMTLGTLQK